LCNITSAALAAFRGQSWRKSGVRFDEAYRFGHALIVRGSCRACREFFYPQKRSNLRLIGVLPSTDDGKTEYSFLTANG